MTLILALSNRSYAIQISDRRLTSNGNLMDDESNKSGILICPNARLSYGYTGLAKFNNFSTINWLNQALSECGKPDYSISGIMQRLKQNATDTFKNDINLKYALKTNKALSIMFTGFINVSGYFEQASVIISNYHDFVNNKRFNVVQDEFQAFFYKADKVFTNPTLIQRIGNWSATKSTDFTSLRNLLEKNVPSYAIVNKSIEVFREIANRPLSQGTIGRQLSSITIFENPMITSQSQYYSETVKPESFMPTLVNLFPNQNIIVDNIKMVAVEKSKPLSVPKVGRNTPCPCGSLKKYKYCHGKNKF